MRQGVPHPSTCGVKSEDTAVDRSRVEPILESSRVRCNVPLTPSAGVEADYAAVHKVAGVREDIEAVGVRVLYPLLFVGPWLQLE